MFRAVPTFRFRAQTSRPSANAANDSCGALVAAILGKIAQALDGRELASAPPPGSGMFAPRAASCAET
eukprot:9138596-Pyramimonas_sp.AAC.1